MHCVKLEPKQLPLGKWFVLNISVLFLQWFAVKSFCWKTFFINNYNISRVKEETLRK